MPTPLAHTSARVLEWDALRELVRGYAASALGQARVDALASSADRAWIERQQKLTQEIREYLRTGARFEFSGLQEISRLLEKSRIEGAALETLEIRDVLLVVDRADEWIQTALNPPADLRSGWPAVAELSSAIGDFTELLRFFRNKILPDGTLDDRASPELAHLRREVEKQKRLIQASLQVYLRRLSDVRAVQEELVTIRGERFVIPVKIEQKKRVNGVVHGASSSGQTVFVEPLETIEQNNELVRLLEEEQAEVHRILLEMTRRIAERAADIARAQDVLAEIELQFAKARFAEDYNCAAVTFVWGRVSDPAGHGSETRAYTRPAGGSPADGSAAVLATVDAGVSPASARAGRPRDSRPEAGATFTLRGARHPLLERNLRAKKLAVVPITVELAPDQRQLIITGPNTGGKTVSLKTVGLLALMAQAGLPVPADSASLPIFDGVLADIGDYQSIEQNLSTFSAHVTNIDRISRTATPDSLVILDELGAATDPEEGAALAVAIAEHFRRIGCISVISSHHTSLKVYGANTAGVLNAAVGFDERTLQPTYELRVGVPGASAGINIAQRLGLNPPIIESARARLGEQAQDVGRFLDRLHAELREAQEERARLQAREQEVQREKAHLAAEGMKEQRARIKELESKLESLLRDFEFRARETVAAVQDRAAALKLSKDAERRIARMRREFREQFDQTLVAHTTGADRGDPHARPQVVKNIMEGDTVKLKSLGRSGVVKRRVADDVFEVEVGAMKMKVARDDIAEVLVRAGSSPVAAARARGISVKLESEDANAPTEINVIGRNVDEATREVEKFVDRAFLAGLPRVRIVHGSGMGILRKALRHYLQQHPHVASVTEPPQNEGGAGATVVELKV